MCFLRYLIGCTLRLILLFLFTVYLYILLNTCSSLREAHCFVLSPDKLLYFLILHSIERNITAKASNAILPRMFVLNPLNSLKVFHFYFEFCKCCVEWRLVPAPQYIYLYIMYVVSARRCARLSVRTFTSCSRFYFLFHENPIAHGR